MDFGFTQQQQEVQGLAQQILGEQVSASTLAQYDEYTAERFDRQLWARLHSAGLASVALPERFGGVGMGFVELALFIEEVGRSIAPIPAICHCVSATMPLARFGTEELQERFLPGVCQGGTLLTAALAEPLNEDPVNPMTMTATPDGQDLLLTGTKVAVPFAAQSGRILMAARSVHGVAVVLVNPDADGVSLQAMQVTTYEPQYEIALEAVRVPACDVICHHDGERIMSWIAARTAAAICAHQLGATDHALRMAAGYTAQREQFGVPVATFQAVGHRMADCYIDVECLRLCTYQAVSLLDSEVDATTQVQIAKIWAGDTGHRVSYATQHVHGGMGIDRDYPLWRYCLWLRHNEMTLGGSTAHIAALGACLARGEAVFN